MRLLGRQILRITLQLFRCQPEALGYHTGYHTRVWEGYRLAVNPTKHIAKDFFSSIGIELHEVFCGQQYSFLGWDIDTVRWLVTMPSKRMNIVIPRLDALAEASWTSVDDYASFKGLLTWLAAVIALYYYYDINFD
eukprot:g32005.t1